ncbi:MAG: deaminated glutathione amidase, partial [Actinomycetota bacterium]|nr:deaminated glutathione amidase [Actinomycetota bacterium]
TPIAEVIARAASHECWVSARIEPEEAMSSLTPGSSVGQVFDHLADRNLALIRRYADDLARPASTSYPHPEPQGDIVD